MNRRHRRQIAIVAFVMVSLIVLPTLAGRAEGEIVKANTHIAKFASQGVDRVEQANSYDQMETFARVAEKKIFGVLERVEKKLGPIDYEHSDITVHNDKVGESITFDPIHICG